MEDKNEPAFGAWQPIETALFQRLKNKTITRNGCWEWQGAKKKFGYGRTIVGSRRNKSRKGMSAHRAMWTAVHGKIPQSKWILHHCDNPACINPEHLYLGTRTENTRDRELRRRNKVPRLKHESHPGSKLTWKDVNEIRAIGINVTQEKIANRYFVKRRTISDILNFKTWIPNPPLKESEGV